MSKNVAMFVDVANLYYSARGQDVDVDYVALLKHATKGRDLIRAYAYSGLDPENENQRKFIDFLGKHGYKVIVKDIRKFGDGRVKANLDIELVVDLFRLRDRMDIAVIVSGDGDFAPAIVALQDEGVRCEVVSFKPNTSSDLIAVADEFFDIMKVAGIARKKGEGSREASLSMPEMPAKEVVPEFGFRAASPAVAAAALAALRTGEPRGAAPRSRRGRRPAAASTDEPVIAVPAVAPAATTDEPTAEDGAPRRRRRRGGRGRGRGRRTEATVGSPAAAAGPEWEEVDDLNQIDGLGEDREYTFEEADDSTLRELGLLDSASAAPSAPAVPEAGPTEEPAAVAPRSRRSRTPRAAAAEAPAEAEEAPKPRRRTSRTAAAKAPAGDADAAEAPKPRRRTSRASAPDAPADAGADAAPKPRRRTTRRAATSDDAQPASDADEAEPQGIWGRFRAGRGTRAE